MEVTICKICKNTSSNKCYIAREMMYGYGDTFEYFECGKCGCLQIKKVPGNLSKYYAKNYYSFRRPNYLSGKFTKCFVERQMTKYCLYGKNILGMLLSTIHEMPYYCNWFKRVGIKVESEILDIGCGVGDLLVRIRRVGFCNLMGVDPYIDDDILYENGVKILKMEMYDIDQQFDFIMLNHSFEHMDKPLSVFKKLRSLLKCNRYVLIRVPVASSFAWRKYGVNWVQLDAPRHLFLHTTESIKILAEQVGLKLVDTTFDSTEFQFWGSEQYVQGIPLTDSKSYGENPQQSVFSRDKIESFKAKAIELNKNNDGDSACFYLYKV